MDVNSIVLPDGINGWGMGEGGAGSGALQRIEPRGPDKGSRDEEVLEGTDSGSVEGGYN